MIKMETMKTRQDIPKKFMDKLYPVVLNLFAERDFHKVNLREIAKAAAMSTGTIYKYFDSKESILFSALQYKISQFEVLARQNIAGLQTSKEIFWTIFQTTMEFYDNNPEVAITAFITIPIRTWMREESYVRTKEKQMLIEIMEEAHQRGDIDPSITTRYVSDLYNMICHRNIHTWYFHGMKWTLKEAMNEWFEVFWKIMDPK